jgi:hypothetical protein
MKKHIKGRIIYGLVTGIIFASIMAAFDYYDDKTLNVLKFIFHLLFFGLFQALFIKFKSRKSEQ